MVTINREHLHHVLEGTQFVLIKNNMEISSININSITIFFLFFNEMALLKIYDPHYLCALDLKQIL